jgi:hypothetical protein
VDAFKVAGGPDRIVEELESVLEEIEQLAA